jgi:hypothetical protein
MCGGDATMRKRSEGGDSDECGRREETSAEEDGVVDDFAAGCGAEGEVESPPAEENGFDDLNAWKPDQSVARGKPESAGGEEAEDREDVRTVLNEAAVDGGGAEEPGGGERGETESGLAVELSGQCWVVRQHGLVCRGRRLLEMERGVQFGGTEGLGGAVLH